MKLRCTHNSIRIRVRKSDLEKLAQDGRVEEVVHISPKSRLVFEVIVGGNQDKVKADFENGRLCLVLPEEKAKHWISSNEVGIEAFQSLPEEDQLHILLEKDFPCLDRADEDKSDTFFELVPDKPEAC